MRKPSKTKALTIRLPDALLAEARRIAPRSLKRDPSRLLEHVLQRWVAERKEHLIDLEITRMGKDPNVIAECRKINKEFELCDGDGLKEGL
jgi:hypothetical protein